MIVKFSSPFRLLAAFARAGYAKFFGYRVLASAEVQNARLAVCNNCDKFDGEDCLVCGCVVGAKVVLATERCPIKKWRRVWEKKHTI